MAKTFELEASMVTVRDNAGAVVTHGNCPEIKWQLVGASDTTIYSKSVTNSWAGLETWLTHDYDAQSGGGSTITIHSTD